MHNAVIAGYRTGNYKNDIFIAGKRVFNVTKADPLVFGPYVIDELLQQLYRIIICT